MTKEPQHVSDSQKQAQRIRLLEEALADYAQRFGISDKARDAFKEFPERARG